MHATWAATDTPVSCFASFGEEAPPYPSGDARRSERAADSFAACDALVDELLEDDCGRHFGALARLREDRDERATTKVEETTGRGFLSCARDAREREPFEDASSRFALVERAQTRGTSDDIGLVAPRASLVSEEAREAVSVAGRRRNKIPSPSWSAPASPFVPRRASDATPRGSPSPATPLDWSKTPPWTPRNAPAAAPVAASNPRVRGATSRAFVQSLARKDNAPASPSASPLSSPDGAGAVEGAPREGTAADGTAASMVPDASSPHSSHGSTCGNGHVGFQERRTCSLDLGVSRARAAGAAAGLGPAGSGYFFSGSPSGETECDARFRMGSATACPGDFFPPVGPPSSKPVNALYKTELCRSWEETGSCRYGGKCQFAHGRDELRPVMRHPKYKTEVCRTFAQSGACPYGTRCRFIHYRVPTRSVCGTLIAGAHNVIPTDWSPETASGSARAASAGEGTSARRGALRAGADARGGVGVGVGDDARDSDGCASNSLDARRLPVFRDLAALSAGPAADSTAGAGFRGGDAAEGRDFSAEPFPFAFVAERRASASAAASAVRRGGAAPPCASGGYDIGASVLFGNV